MVTELPHSAKRDRVVRSCCNRGNRSGQTGRDSDIHSLVGGAAEVLGAEAGQEVFGDRFQQRFKLDIYPHLNQDLILERVCFRVEIQRPLQAEKWHSRHAGPLWM